MKKIVHTGIKAGLLGLMFSATAMASDAIAPIGTLQAGSHVNIQNELGSFPVSETYTVLAGDQIKIGESDFIATLRLDGGILYISPNSVTTLSKSNGVYTLVLDSGSVGYELEDAGKLVIRSGGQEITPTASEGAISGAVALGLNGKLVISPVSGNAVVATENGVVTKIAQGQTWANTQQGAKLTLTQAEPLATGLGAGATTAIVVGGIAGGALIYDKVIKDDDSKSPSS